MSKYVKDLTERVVATFAFTFLSVFSFTEMSTAKDAAIAGGAAVASLVKGLLASFLGDKESAGLTNG